MGDMTENFSREEFACKDGCGFDDISPSLVAALQELRTATGQRITVRSGCRCPARNAAVNGEADSQHMKGKAADIVIEGLGVEAMYHEAEKILPLRNGGIGVYPGEGFIHVDVRGERKRWARVNGEYLPIETVIH